MENMAICDFRYGKLLSQRSGLTMCINSTNENVNMCENGNCSNVALVATIYGNSENVTLGSKREDTNVNIVMLCGHHFDLLVNRLGRFEEMLDVTSLDGTPYIEDRCAVKMNELMYHSKFLTMSVCSGPTSMRRAEFLGKPAIAGYVCSAHWKCMQCGINPGGGSRFKKYTEFTSDEAWGLLCMQCSEHRAWVFATVAAASMVLGVLAGTVTCNCGQPVNDNKVELNNGLLARKKSVLTKYSEYKELGSQLKKEMCKQGGMPDELYEYLSEKIDGATLDDKIALRRSKVL